MKYLTHNGHQLATKNKLQTAVQEYLKDIDRTFLRDKIDLEDIKLKIIAHIVFFNNEYPRCTPISASWSQLSSNDWFLSGVGFCNFIIYHSKKDY